MFDWVLNNPLASLYCVSYLAISMIIATLASCDQIIFEISLYVFFQYVWVSFVKLETEFTEIIHSQQINEITCLSDRILTSVILYSQVCFFFHFSINCIKALKRITIMEMAVKQQVVAVATILMNHLAIRILMMQQQCYKDEIVSSNEKSNSTVRKQ